MYIFNPGTNLYYLVTSTVESETGLITLSVSQTGVAADPGYQPSLGDPLVPVEYYCMVFGIDEAQLDGNKYNLLAMAVTRQIERYCCTTWVDLTVPEDLMYIAANMIRDRYDMVDNHKDSRLQSESVKNYSYTLAAGTQGQAVLAKYQEDLSAFRILPFA